MRTNTQPKRLSYDHAKFVDRTDEVRLVLDKAHNLAVASFEDKRVVIFHGARGAGKSWLLHEIEYQLKQTLPTVLTVYLDLAEFSAPPVDDAVWALITQIRGAIADRLGSSPLQTQQSESLSMLASVLIDGVKRVPVLLLLIDHVNESSREMLALLEDRCLELLAVEPRVLIVLAGRGREYTWKSMELRLRSEERELPYFDLAWTREQLKRHDPQLAQAAEEIQSLGAGYPWSNYILSVNQANRADALAQCIDFLIRDLPVSDDDRDHLEALCVLNAISDEMLPRMFAAYYNDPTYLTWRYTQYREARQALIRTTLVKWKEEMGGYVMDEALSHVLEHWMYEHDRLIWERLHRAARDLFRDWADKYPRLADHWQKEIEYHDERLMHGPFWTPTP